MNTSVPIELAGASRDAEYPKPGRQQRKPVRILAAPGFRNAPLNPYCRLLYTEMCRLGATVEEFSVYRMVPRRFDIFHLHWPEYFISQKNPFKALLGAAMLLWECIWQRCLGTRVIWTAHNTRTHNHIRPRGERLFWWCFTRLVDGYICLSEQSCRELEREHPALKGRPHCIVPHGHYRNAYICNIDPGAARSRLGISADEKVVLFFGVIAPYKNVTRLISVFQQLSKPKLRLVIAGLCANSDCRAEINDAAQKDSRICLRMDFVPANEVQVYFRACDLVVLPFAEIHNSGSTLLALSFDRPVLVPQMGSIPDLQHQVGPNWVRTYRGELSVDALREALDWSIGEDRASEAPLGLMDWDRIGRATLNFLASFQQKGAEKPHQAQTREPGQDTVNCLQR